MPQTPYIVFYRVMADAPEILHVFHERQDWTHVADRDSGVARNSGPAPETRAARDREHGEVSEHASDGERGAEQPNRGYRQFAFFSEANAISLARAPGIVFDADRVDSPWAPATTPTTASRMSYRARA